MGFWKKYVFLQALFLTIVMFLIGMYVGIAFEQNQFDEMEGYYLKSEISLMDIVALNNLVMNKNISCEVLKEASFNYADKIYEEATLLEDYEKSGKISEKMTEVHKKYDLLRTILWMNVIKTRERCKTDFNSVVYLYNYSVKDLTLKAEQSFLSKVLYKLKKDNPDKVILIPIAVDGNFVSLESLKSEWNITEYPVVIINDKQLVYDINSSSNLEKYFK